ncbi:MULTISPECIES: IS5 family transposase [Comamonas]|uniref:IS5 family transposase n=1 Tax=Comamonas TaxID=283 RepID=UPI00237E2DB9|nr:IS5 family transposase [Comamonas aquatica]MDE1554380.1 IS5 family transposase [Comamonas aquatica]
MTQTSLGLDWTNKRTRKREFLGEMERVVPWSALVALIESHSPRAKTGRPPFPIETMLRIHFMQNWFTFGDQVMEEALIDTPLYREFARLNVDADRLPDAITILRFRHLLERHGLAQQMFVAVNELLAAKGLVVKSGTAVDATIINAPSSTKNSSGQRDPDMHQTKKGQQWYFGMKAHVGTDLGTGVVHSLVTTSANAADVTQVDGLLHGQETDVFADAGYQGAARWTRAKVRWHIAMRPGKRRALDTGTEKDRLIDELERVKARIRAKGEHAFRVIKRQFGFTKVSYRGLAKNTAKLHTLFMLGNLWMLRKRPQLCGA